GHWRDVAEHPGADLHEHQLREVETLMEREEAETQETWVDEVSRGIAADQHHRLARIAEHGPEIVQRTLDRGHDRATDPGDREQHAEDRRDDGDRDQRLAPR